MMGYQVASGFYTFSDHDEATLQPHLTFQEYEVLARRVEESKNAIREQMNYAMKLFDEMVESFLWSLVDDVCDESEEPCIEEPCYLYFIENSDRDLVKIGISVNPEARLSQLNTACGDTCVLIRTFEFKSRGDALVAERALHRFYSPSRRCLHGRNRGTEWFEGSIRTSDKLGCIPLYSLKTVSDILENFFYDIEREGGFEHDYTR